MFKMKFKTSNAAFDDSPLYETAAMLEQVAAKLRAGHREGLVVDSNGNQIGKFNLQLEAN